MEMNIDKVIEDCHYPYIRKDVSSAKTLPIDTFDIDRSLTTQLFHFKNYLHLISCVSSISHVIFNSVAYLVSEIEPISMPGSIWYWLRF